MISVIVPVYNTEDYVSECLDSLINQSFVDLEILCINDGSTDNSLNILCDYADKDTRIRVVTQENCGPAYSRNKGVQLAQGEYIYFMDSDDVLADNAIQKLYDVAEANKSEVVFFDGSAFFETESLEEKFPCYKSEYEKFDEINGVVDGIQLLDWYEKYNKFVVSPCLVFLRKDYLIKHKINFYNDILYEDNLFHIKLLLALEKGYVLHEKLFYRRVRNNSIMTTQKKSFKHIYSYFICYYELVRLLPTFEVIGKDNCLALMLNVFYKSILSVAMDMKGERFSTDDIKYHKKLSIIQKELLAQLGVVVKPKLSSITKYCAGYTYIVVYGAAAIGIEICRYLKPVSKIEIVDRAVRLLPKDLDLVLKQPDDLCGTKADIIIVTVKSEAVAEGIKEQLCTKYGVNKDRVLWYGECVDYYL